MQEPVLPPISCPPQVLPLLDAAHTNHHDGNVEEALDLYSAAKKVWLDTLAAEASPWVATTANAGSGWGAAAADDDDEASNNHSSAAGGSSMGGGDQQQSNMQQQQEQQQLAGFQESGREVLLPAAAELYFSAVLSSVHLTAGADQAAWHVLVEAVPALVELHEAGAEAGLWHSCAAVVLYHLDQPQVRREGLRDSG